MFVLTRPVRVDCDADALSETLVIQNSKMGKGKGIRREGLFRKF
jgi:hypothetical protein